MEYNTPKDCLYSTSHEWIRTDGEVATVGITDFAQNTLGDIVFVELPDVGVTVSKGDSFGVIESVKAASDLYAPISGEVIEVNATLMETPEMLNHLPYTRGWMVKMRTTNFEAEKSELLDAAAYEKHVEDEASKL